ncbi:MAG TPA: hypothetical protein VHM26_00710 [Chitinophagaceae bacterium]|jgi:hypothetical protein|nr:hypothetical protein [Chitinophagaceae bacterium]
MRFLSLIAIIAFAAMPVKKPVTIILKEKLLEASYIDYVEVTGYTDSTILFKPVDNVQGFYSLEWSQDDNGIYKPFSKDGIHSARATRFKRTKDQYPWLMGYWPEKGENVLIVVNERSEGVSLFAYKEGKDYRFWSPYWGASICIFRFEKPARILPGNAISDSASWDGCLLPVDSLIMYGRKDQRRTMTGTTMVSDGKALFIYDFSDSQPFELDGVDKWDTKYLNKHIEVEGVLVQFVEGRSLIKDWKIRVIDPLSTH